jgi:PAS domain-containing protein
MSDNHRTRVSVGLHYVLILVCAISITLYFVDRIQHEKELRQFSESLEAADAGRWHWDLERDVLHWDDQMFRLFGRDKQQWTSGYDGFSSFLVPEDRERVNAKVDRAILERGGYHDVFNVITDAGEVRAIRAAALVSRDGSYMTGICMPVVPREGNFHRERSSTGSGLPFYLPRSPQIADYVSSPDSPPAPN